MKSLEAIHDPIVKKILELLSRKATVKAKYFCAGMLDIAKYQHYALSVPLYTHFTSPIRRYADVLVHRQLDSILQAGGEREWTFTDLIVYWLIFALQSPSLRWTVTLSPRLLSSATCTLKSYPDSKH